MSDLPAEIIEIIYSNDSKHIKLARILKYIVDTYDIDQSKYYILGSYAIREHRNISDLDISARFDAFDKLPKEHLGIIELYNNQIRWFLDMTQEYNKVDPDATDFSIEMFRKCDGEGFPTADYSLGKLKESNALDTDEFGHQFMSLETLLKWKKEMNRPKDAKDIELIESLLTNSTGGSNNSTDDSLITGSNEPIMRGTSDRGFQFSHLALGLLILLLLLVMFIECISDCANAVYEHVWFHLDL